MVNFSSQLLAQLTGGEWENGNIGEGGLSYEFCYDTRLIQPGSIFLALKTDKSDGHLYLDEAFKNGAIAAVVEHPNLNLHFPQLKVNNTLQAFHQIAHHHRLQFKHPVIAITGSCGKTSTKDLLKLILGPTTYATHKNYNNLLGVPLSLTEIDLDEHTYAVIEAGINVVGEMDQLAQTIEPDMSVITLIGPSHLEGLGSEAVIMSEKTKLFQHTRSSGRLFFSSSCLRFPYFQQLPQLAFSLHPKTIPIVDFPINNNLFNISFYYEVMDKSRSRIFLELFDGLGNEKVFEFPSINPGMIHNAAIAISIADYLKIPLEIIQERLNRWVPSDQRGQIYYDDERIYYVDTYNANPVSMLNGVLHFQSLTAPESRKLYIIGCMGELGHASESLHYNLGMNLKISSHDQVVIIQNESIQHAEALKNGLLRMGHSSDNIMIVTDTLSAESWIKDFDGDIFLKGSSKLQLHQLVSNLLSYKMIS